jgi:hypothetical protein
MTPAYSKRLETAITEGASLLRPGWVRLNFNYFIADAECEYLLAALELVAEHGWRLLPSYHYDSDHGVWRYRGHPGCDRDPLASLCWQSWVSPSAATVEAPDFPRYLALARAELLHPREDVCCAVPLAPAHEALRWFAVATD